jgi:hypothetical protein
MSTMRYTIVSKHFLKRTAQARAQWMRERDDHEYIVVKTDRSPYRYNVIRNDDCPSFFENANA